MVSVACSILLYPVCTIFFEHFYLSATFETLRVYEKSWNNECVASLFLINMLVVVLSLLPDYLFVVWNFLRTAFKLLEYHENQSVNQPATSSYDVEKAKHVKQQNSGCCAGGIFNKRKKVNFAPEQNTDGKSFVNGSVIPTDENDRIRQISERKCATGNGSRATHSSTIEPLNATALQTESLAKPAHHVQELENLGRNGENAGAARPSSDFGQERTEIVKGGDGNGLNAGIANILFNEQNKVRVQINVDALRQSSIPIVVVPENKAMAEACLPTNAFDNPSFEQSTPEHEKSKL